MDISSIFIVIISSVIVIDLLLHHVLQIFPLLFAPDKPGTAAAAGLASMMIMVLSSGITFASCYYIFERAQMEYLKIPVFAACAVLIASAAWMLLKKTFSSRSGRIGPYLFPVTVACASIGSYLLYLHPGFITSDTGLARSIANGFIAGAGIFTVLMIMNGITKRLELADVTQFMKGLPVTFVAAGLLALAFYGLAGIRI